MGFVQILLRLIIFNRSLYRDNPWFPVNVFEKLFAEAHAPRLSQ